MYRIEKFFMPLGMIGVIFYFTHIFLGQILWSEYNPVTMDISSLTAVGAPNAGLLRIFTLFYGIFTILFAIGLIIKAFRKYGILVKTGYIVLFIMEFTSLLGYAMFPLTGDKTEMNFQNMMHIVVTAVVVFTTIASGYLLSIGYIRQDKLRGLGRFILVISILITLFGFSNPVGMGLKLDILGLTERMVIFSLQLMMFVISAYYTFSKSESR
ncbi:DUF998 domain-containing protein [Ruminiclostridium cellobioparum]|jgi:hypothetical protein|uniref:DUF998 domain-containing protein n=1 Tax=Ruminiclostridium cellobioparum TaxID=29355 RepID=UPI000488E47C|nr:DUF998 domain-containing protein [Ruminiclostridium cellobioparum]